MNKDKQKFEEKVILDTRYSTTQNVITSKPCIINDIEDSFESMLFLPITKGRINQGGLRVNGYFKSSSPSKPLISIVTVALNSVNTLEQTILSVINQQYENVEYIIVDGGSNDGTLSILQMYNDAIDYWVSERDGGIYDAMNKGISLCCGDCIGIINSDDYYEYDALDYVHKKVGRNILIYGDLLSHFEGGRVLLHSVKPPASLQEMKIGTVHPTVFVDRLIYKRIGLFDTSFKISADYDLLLRIFLAQCSIVKIDRILANFREGGASRYGAPRKERFEIAKKYNLGLLHSIKICFSLVRFRVKRSAPFFVKLKRRFYDSK